MADKQKDAYFELARRAKIQLDACECPEDLKKLDPDVYDHVHETVWQWFTRPRLGFSYCYDMQRKFPHVKSFFRLEWMMDLPEFQVPPKPPVTLH